MSEQFNKDGLILSSNYADTMNSVVLPYLKAKEKVHAALKGCEGKPLYCVSYPADAAKGCCGSVYDLPADPALGGGTAWTAGVLEAECAAVLAEFFGGRRR